MKFFFFIVFDVLKSECHHWVYTLSIVFDEELKSRETNGCDI